MDVRRAGSAWSDEEEVAGESPGLATKPSTLWQMRHRHKAATPLTWAARAMTTLHELISTNAINIATGKDQRGARSRQALVRLSVCSMPADATMRLLEGRPGQALRVLITLAMNA